MMRETIRINSPISDPEWLHIARHEAAHAVAYILAATDIYRNDYGVRSVCIRPGKSNFYIDRKGRPHYCLGICEGVSPYSAPGIGMAQHISEFQPDLVPAVTHAAEWEIVASVSGPYAEMKSIGITASRQMRWAARNYRGGDGDFRRADAVFADIRVLAGRRAGWVKLLDRTRTLVFEHWHAIDALAREMLIRHELEYADIVQIVSPHLPGCAEARLAA